MQGKKYFSLLPAYRIIALIFILSFLLSNSAYAQEYSKLDSLKPGVTYKIILFDDTEIIGKIIKHDSEFVIVSTGLTNTQIRKDDIFNISKNLTPSKYRFSFSGGGGVSILTEGFFNHSYKNYSSIFSLQVNAAFFANNKRAFRLDLGYSRFKRKDDSYPYYTEYKGGDLGMYYFKTEFMMGDLNPSSLVNAYGLVGLGIHITKEEEYTYKYYNSWDSTYHTYIYPVQTNTNAVLSLGGGLGFRFNKHLGVYTEIQYNMVTVGGGFFIFGFGSGYFPIRAGLTYYIY
jgi:hypothetical protein